MRWALISLVALAGTAGLAAQSTGFGVAQMETVGPDGKAKAQVFKIEHPCAAAMRLEQGSSAQILETADGKREPMMTPTLHLFPYTGKRVIVVRVTVHGYPPVAGPQPAQANLISPGRQPKREELTRTLDVKMKPAAGGYAGELLLPGFSALTRLDLKALTYADGSTWRVAGANTCSVAPDPLLLISVR